MDPIRGRQEVKKVIGAFQWAMLLEFMSQLFVHVRGIAWDVCQSLDQSLGSFNFPFISWLNGMASAPVSEVYHAAFIASVGGLVLRPCLIYFQR